MSRHWQRPLSGETNRLGPGGERMLEGNFCGLRGELFSSIRKAAVVGKSRCHSLEHRKSRWSNQVSIEEINATLTHIADLNRAQVQTDSSAITTQN